MIEYHPFLKEIARAGNKTANEEKGEKIRNIKYFTNFIDFVSKLKGFMKKNNVEDPE